MTDFKSIPLINAYNEIFNVLNDNFKSLILCNRFNGCQQGKPFSNQINGHVFKKN
jgi:hypothetical protein